MILANGLSSDMLTALIAAMGALDDAELELLQGAVPSSSAALLADFTVANFDGYAPATIADTAYVGPASTADGQQYVATPWTAFTADDPLVVPNTVTGWLLHNGATLLAWQAVTPVLVDRPGQIVFAQGGIAMGQTAEVIGGVTTE